MLSVVTSHVRDAEHRVIDADLAASLRTLPGCATSSSTATTR
jgi:hypothetical protein